jgi:hypothetical protein
LHICGKYGKGWENELPEHIRGGFARFRAQVYGFGARGHKGMKAVDLIQWATRVSGSRTAIPALLILVLLLQVTARGQTNCEAGNGELDSAPPKTMSSQDVIQKFGAAEAATKEARLHYAYRQDVLMQTLVGTSVTGEFHEVTFAAQPSLRGIQLTQEDMEDIRSIMPLMLATDDVALYNLTYSGQQHVDDLDTYVFHAEPKKEEKDRRYFQGRIWVDARDFQIVKVCGKSGPEKVQVKKHERPELHPMFVTYRQQVDDHYWFPAYTRSDDTLQFRSGGVHIREIIKYTSYKRVDGK